MKFERRDIILIAGLILVMLGLIQYLGPAYSAIIVIGLYFGVKIYVGKKRQLIQQDVGEGICMECGSKIINKKCPNCDVFEE
jgi:hypothetical protein